VADVDTAPPEPAADLGSLDDTTGPAWRTPVAWVASIVLLLVASGGPVTWARAELADLTVAPADDIWIQAVFLVAAGLVVAFCGDGVALLRHDRAVLIPIGIFLALLAVSTAWSDDSARTFEQMLLITFGTAAALVGGSWLGRTQVLTSLWIALHLGVLFSAFAHLREWPLAADGAGDLTGLFGTTDTMGMIAVLAVASSIMMMVVVLGRTPEEKLAAAEAKATGGGLRMPSMRNINQLTRYGKAAQRGQLPPGGAGMRAPRTPGQAMQYRTMARGRRQRAGSMGGLKASSLGRLATTVVLVGFVTIDLMSLWLSQSYGALFAVTIAAVVMLVVGLCLPGSSESTRRGVAGVVTVVSAAAIVALVVFRETVGDWFDRDGTWSGRTTLWDAVLREARERPLHGFGFEAGSGTGATDARSGFLQILLGVGLLGLMSLVVVMIVALRRSGSAAMIRPDTLAVWTVGLVAFGIAANVNESYVSAFSLPWLLLVFGLGHAVARREERFDDTIF
jgi:hypothetical protein